MVVALALWRVNEPVVLADHRLVSGFPASLRGPSLSPDGGTMAFVDDAHGGPQIWLKSLTGGGATELTFLNGTGLGATRWSARGDSLLFNQVRPKDSLRKVSSRGGESTEVLPWTWDTWVELDPREEAIIFVRGRQVVIRQLQSGREMTIDRPLENARWSPDGQMIFATETVRAGAFNTWTVVRCAVGATSCSTLTSGHSVVPSRDGRRIYFMRPGTAGMRGLWSADINGRDERDLGDIGPFRRPDVSFDVSPRDMIVWPAFHAGTPEIWMAALR
jgi:Tol biopolymer transport system component